jgi:hypothetical protein
MLSTVRDAQKRAFALGEVEQGKSAGDGVNCWKCRRQIEVKERVGFRDHCPGCDRALHACLNCGFHDPAYNNQCRETQAERVVDKERFNFCEFFAPGSTVKATPLSPANDPRAKLDQLFKKKP